MKKVLISDYDGTFYTDEVQIGKNVESINNFRGNGNIFVIATARGIGSIRKEIEKYNINCDYIISDMGGIVVDVRTDEIIYKRLMSELQIDYVENILKKYSEIEISRFGLGDENMMGKDVVGYKIKSDSVENLMEIKKKIDNENIYNLVTRMAEREKKLFINNLLNTKLKAIDNLLLRLNVDSKNVYTIGDSDDDLEMLEKYNGYRMFEVTENVRKRISNNVKDFQMLMNYID